MTREETKTIYAMVRTNFPKWYKDQTPAEMKATVTMWTEVFKNDSPADIQRGLVEYLREDKTGFPPTPGQLRQYSRPKVQYMPGEAAWQMVLRACTWHRDEAIERFNAFPKDVQDALGGYSVLMTIAGCSIEKDLPWRRKEFMQNYQEIVEESESMLNRGRWALEYVQEKNRTSRDALLIAPSGKLLDAPVNEANALPWLERI